MSSRQWAKDMFDRIDAAAKAERITLWDAHRMRLAVGCDLFVQDGGTREGYLTEVIIEPDYRSILEGVEVE